MQGGATILGHQRRDSKTMIDFLRRLFGGGGRDSSRVRCAGCRAEMVIVSGMAMPSSMTSHLNGCTRCTTCGAHECYECSDTRRACKCGHQQWQERSYILAGDMKRCFPNIEVFESPFVRWGDGSPMRGFRDKRR